MKEDRLIVRQLQYFRECLLEYQTFTDQEWTLFSAAITYRTLKKKELLFNIGEVYQVMAFIFEGAVRYFIERDGEIMTNYFSFKGELITSYSSFISGKPSRVGIGAIDTTQLLIIPKEHFDALSENPAIALKMEQMRRRIAEYYILCYEERIGSFLLESPEERYLSLLHSGGEIFKRIPQHYIANYLGITPVSLSRIRNRSLGKP
jgi:CRP-like cAMP-binding protein